MSPQPLLRRFGALACAAALLSPGAFAQGDDTCDVDGGELAFAGGATDTAIVVDGVPDPLDVAFVAEPSGPNAAWVITDDSLNILALPAAPPFDLDPAGLGTCLIWYVTFEEGLEGAEMGANAADLSGCFDLSNPLTVERVAPDDACDVDGGELAFAGGATDTAIVVDGVPDPLDVAFVAEPSGPNAAWVITDDSLNILALPAAPPFDLDPAGLGTCLIWYVTFEEGLEGAEMGANAADLSGCFDLSNPLTVERVAPDDACDVDGGEIVFADGTTETTIVVDGEPDPLDVTFVAPSSGTNAAWVITDDELTILALPPAPPFDLDGAGVGTCLIWYLRFEDGLEGAEMGANAADLAGCFDLSNPLTVERVAPEAETSGLVAAANQPGAGADVQVTVAPAAEAAVEAVEVYLSDRNGRVVATQSVGRVDAATTVALPVAGQVGGLYVVTVRSAAGLESQLVNVQ